VKVSYTVNESPSEESINTPELIKYQESINAAELIKTAESIILIE
jgi:hypothetical protein